MKITEKGVRRRKRNRCPGMKNGARLHNRDIGLLLQACEKMGRVLQHFNHVCWGLRVCLGRGSFHPNHIHTNLLFLQRTQALRTMVWAGVGQEAFPPFLKKVSSSLSWACSKQVGEKSTLKLFRHLVFVARCCVVEGADGVERPDRLRHFMGLGAMTNKIQNQKAPRIGPGPLISVSRFALVASRLGSPLGPPYSMIYMIANKSILHLPWPRDSVPVARSFSPSLPEWWRPKNDEFNALQYPQVRGMLSQAVITQLITSSLVGFKTTPALESSLFPLGFS